MLNHFCYIYFECISYIPCGRFLMPFELTLDSFVVATRTKTRNGTRF